MYQTWSHLLFLHWRVPEEHLRRHIPQTLEIDTYEGSAWVGVTPFTISGMRVPMMPAIPFVSESHEINVRTYVHHDGVPGVWFFSLDASNPAAVLGARVGFGLPYRQALMSLEVEDDRVTFHSKRLAPGATPAQFDARWTLRPEPIETEPDSLDEFLLERYVLYTDRGGDLYRARIHHRSWPLRRARLESMSSSMLQANGLPVPDPDPMIHAQAEPIDVEVFPIERVKLTREAPSPDREM